MVTWCLRAIADNSRIGVSTMADVSEQTATMTFEEFLAWLDEDTHAEWVEGKVMVPSPASARHQLIQRFLVTLLGLYAESHDLGVVLPAPFVMRLAGRAREPDLLFVAREHADRIGETFLDGPADLVVEIISPESIARDRGEKYREYRDAGVGEYWLIDPLAQEAECYQLDAGGQYHLALTHADGIYTSRSLPGFWLEVEWLWQMPLPNVLQALKRIDRAAFDRYAGE
jgi:Uma2 family endonuclease